MKTILSLSRTLPWPLDRGERIRLNSFLEAFRKSFDKIKWCSIYSEADEQILPELEAQYPDVAFSLIKILPERGMSATNSLFYPELVKRFYDRNAINSFQEDIIKGGYTFLFFKGIQFVPWFTDEEGALAELAPKTMFDLDDIESKKLKRQIQTLHFGKGGYYLNRILEWARLVHFEKKKIHKFKTVLITSEKDRFELESRNGLNNVKIIKNCVSIPQQKNRLDKKSILFLGSLGYDPNEDAVKYFLDEISPILIMADPSIKFYIAGGAPPQWLKRRSDDKNIYVLGFVASLQSLLVSHGIMVVPLRIGGGTRLKILDAAAHGIPVVSTSIGNEGLLFKDEKDILLADTPEEFARKCLRLLADSNLKKKLTQNANSIVEKNYSFEVVQKDIMQLC